MFSSVRFYLAMCASLPVAAQQATGNGSLGGPHFELNLIGRKSAYPGGEKSGGSVIFCCQDGTSDIFLKPGPFEVRDANATTEGRPHNVFQ